MPQRCGIYFFFKVKKVKFVQSVNTPQLLASNHSTSQWVAYLESWIMIRWKKIFKPNRYTYSASIFSHSSGIRGLVCLKCFKICHTIFKIWKIMWYFYYHIIPFSYSKNINNFEALRHFMKKSKKLLFLMSDSSRPLLWFWLPLLGFSF